MTTTEETDAKIDELLNRVVYLTVETRRDSQQTRRIWTAFARQPEDPENLDDET